MQKGYFKISTKALNNLFLICAMHYFIITSVKEFVWALIFYLQAKIVIPGDKNILFSIPVYVQASMRPVFRYFFFCYQTELKQLNVMGKKALLNASKGWIADLTALWVFEATLSPGLQRDAQQ